MLVLHIATLATDELFGDEHHQDTKLICKKVMLNTKLNSPAAVRPHVSQENENVIENLQMHEHPDR